jgi:hypothetical protein
VWGCRIVKGLCRYTSSVFRSLILACISISILRELRHGTHCSAALPPGLTVEAFSSFFTNLFTYQTSGERHAFKTNIALLLLNPNYHVLAITIPVFDVQDPSNLLTHFIVGAALFMFDNKRGSYINCLGVVDKGPPGVCMLNGSYFVEPSTSNLLSDTACFRALGIGISSCLVSKCLALLPTNPQLLLDRIPFN